MTGVSGTGGYARAMGVSGTGACDSVGETGETGREDRYSRLDDERGESVLLGLGEEGREGGCGSGMIDLVGWGARRADLRGSSGSV